MVTMHNVIMVTMHNGIMATMHNRIIIHCFHIIETNNYYTLLLLYTGIIIIIHNYTPRFDYNIVYDIASNMYSKEFIHMNNTSTI